ALLVALAITYAQPSLGAQEPKIRSKVSRVLVDALATDQRTGEPLDDLTQDDFVLRDDGKPISLANFNRGKDQTLRPVQVWFVLHCNEDLRYHLTGRRRSSMEITERWGVSVLSGKMAELLPALAHLKADETVGVAHWCDNGDSDIDLSPSPDRAAVVDTMERLAQKKPVFVEGNGGSAEPSLEVTRRINNVVRTEFPEPFPAVIFVGGKQANGDDGRSKDAWSGSLQESSTDFGSQAGSVLSGSDTTAYGVQQSNYVSRLGIYFDSLHRRYELGFVPAKQDNKLHHISLALTKSTRQKYPNAALRYREVYSNDDGNDPQDKTVKGLKNLDRKMQAAVNSPTDRSDWKFDVRQTAGAKSGAQEFLLQIPPGNLTWSILQNGDRRCVITTVAASYSAKGKPIGIVVKELEIVQESGRLPTLKDKPVSLPLTFALAKDASKVRVLVREGATGPIGAHDLSISKSSQ
ncbi:MAG TPA: hypothetical protein VGF20_07805, partial [Candidatus Acidoferrum sp.]